MLHRCTHTSWQAPTRHARAIWRSSDTRTTIIILPFKCTRSSGQRRQCARTLVARARSPFPSALAAMRRHSAAVSLLASISPGFVTSTSRVLALEYSQREQRLLLSQSMTDRFRLERGVVVAGVVVLCPCKWMFRSACCSSNIRGCVSSCVISVRTKLVALTNGGRQW
jgi:hypothetical protein